MKKLCSLVFAFIFMPSFARANEANVIASYYFYFVLAPLIAGTIALSVIGYLQRKSRWEIQPWALRAFLTMVGGGLMVAGLITQTITIVILKENANFLGMIILGLAPLFLSALTLLWAFKGFGLDQ
jgi:hypothetical protein